MKTLVIVLAAGFIGLLLWQYFCPAGRACVAKGGKYYILDDGCYRETFVQVKI